MAKIKSVDLSGMEPHECGAIRNYFRIYNAEVEQFMDPLASSADLDDSYVHVNSRVRWLEKEQQVMIPEAEDDAEGIDMGVLWSREEKQLFFHYLSRYSIHRLDEWHFKIGTKSRFEILTYYSILDENLTLLKRLDSKKHGRILAKQDIPIAYEMDEFFCELEDDLSLSLQLESPEEICTAQDLDDTLISNENWYKRWSPLYSKHGIEEMQPACRLPLKFSRDAMEFMTQCAKGYLRRLLYFCVLPNLHIPHIEREQLDDQGALLARLTHAMETDTSNMSATGNSEHELLDNLPHFVTHKDVIGGIWAMREEGFMAPTLAETILLALEKFKLTCEKGKLFKTSHIANGVLAGVLAAHSSNKDLIFKNPSLLAQQETSPWEEQGILSPPHRKLYNLAGKKVDAQLFFENKLENQLDNPLELELCYLEEQNTDSKDLQDSAIYQHVMLQYLSAASPAVNYDLKPVPPQASDAIPKSVLREYQFE
ncbi:LAMI_0H17392g1_1 [Lachancea mirantina]|uniref:LAMI_0H17392g1_1 n=1 Tax=Lachancea mirantina TaxID=1230905 RepID=A0A1G4KJ58_9SACH|nr:LAMI_0H17392g1_1 [Lachancea mirantina]